MVVAGVAGFKTRVTPTNESAKLIRDWIDNESFVWLVTADIINESGVSMFARRSSERSSTCCGKKLNWSHRQD